MSNYKVERNRSATDPEFISMLAKRLGKSPEETKKIVKEMIECMRENIELNGILNLRRLGRFVIKARRNMQIRNFKKQVVKIPILYTLRFRASDSIRRMINRKITRNRDKEISGK